MRTRKPCSFAIRLLLLLLWAAVIFLFSAQDAQTSGDLSLGVAELQLRWLALFGITAESINALPFDPIVVIRKAAHFCSFFVLGLLSLWTVSAKDPPPLQRLTPRRRILIAFLFCVAYAVSDEIHQLFVSGRSGQASDVLLDSVSAACGIAVFLLAKKRSNRKSRKTRFA